MTRWICLDCNTVCMCVDSAIAHGKANGHRNFQIVKPSHKKSCFDCKDSSGDCCTGVPYPIQNCVDNNYKYWRERYED